MFKNNDKTEYNSIVSTILNEFAILQKIPEGRVIVLHTIPSTNQYLIDNFQYIKSGDVVVTENQTQGRGRKGRIWITPAGQSICLSIYWKLCQKLLNLNTIELSVIISFVLATVLKKLGTPHIQIKYPNDIYVYNKKLAGILVEVINQNRYFSHLIIGIGINISICFDTKLKIKISNNWIDLNHIGIFPDRNFLVAILVKKLRLVLSNLTVIDSCR